MTVSELCEKAQLKTICVSDAAAEVSGCYIGDLLSLVMSRAQEGEAWLTVQSNVNIVAVAVLTGISCVVVTEGMEIPKETVQKAEEQGVTLLGSDEPIFAIARRIAELL